MIYFVTAIDTDSGKTLASAILCEALQADYWKPIQAGLPRDADTISSLITNTKIAIHPERHLLKIPASPHASAKAEGISIQLTDFALPQILNTLIIEGAGGCLVPINNNHFVIDLAIQLKAEIILVADLYLGSINHTLLTASLLKQKQVLVKGVIFNGEPNEESEQIILHHTGYRKLLHIQPEKIITPQVVKHYANKLLLHWNE